MESTSIYRTVMILLLLSSRIAMAQVAIPDANFRQFLKTKYPTVIRNDQTLDTTVSKTINTAFKCYSQNITDLSGIQYFKNIITLEVKYNPGLMSLPNIDALTKIKTLGLDSNALTVLPSLTKLASLQILSAHHNQLTVIPNVTPLITLKVLFVDHNQLTSIPDLSANINMEQVMCSYNPIASLPDFSLLTKLTTLLVDHTQISILPDLSKSLLLYNLSASDCNLSTLPDFSANTDLTVLYLDNNKISFQYLLQFANHTLTDFYVSPQSVGNASTKNLSERAQFIFDAGIDANVSTNIYTWYKNGNVFKTTSTNKLIIDTLAFSDAGVYTCTVTNTTPAMAGVAVNVASVTLSVSACLTGNKYRFELLNQECQYPIKVAFDESAITGGTKPFTYTLTNGKEKLIENSAVFSLNKEGSYQVTVRDGRGCKLNFADPLFISRRADCDPVFLPNGDGVADTYFINETGIAKIYNKNGILVKELNAPNSWDGTNSNNNDAPTGLYVIVVNDVHIRVTLLR